MIGTVPLLMHAKVDYVTLMTVSLLVVHVGTLLYDLSAAAWMRFRLWPVIMVLMDSALIFDVAQGVQYWFIIVTLLHTTATTMDNAFSFGLLDAVIDFEGGRDSQPPMWQCDCPVPPCSGQPGGVALQAWVVGVFFFVTDYYLTRRFSVQLRNQLNVVAATVRVSERMTELLAAYATDDARRELAEQGTALPTALLFSYGQLLDNLDSYRVFLPDSLLYPQQHLQQWENDPHAGTAAQGPSAVAVQPASRVAPGSGGGKAHIAMCFTDIQSSTELWEVYPQGMYTALNMHNALMRSCYAACNGYEVKTIGDSFMVAFDCGFDALRFGLEAQLGLLRQKWPDDLICHPLCQPIADSGGVPLWGGLRVRIAVHSGEARVQRNPVTGRSDYFGPTVNTTGRLEGVLRNGGLVAVSGTVVGDLSAEELSALGSPVLHAMGDRELKGVRDKVTVWAVVPQALAERIAVLAGDADRAAWTPGSSGRSPLSCGSQSRNSPIYRQPDLSPRRLRCSKASCATARLPLSATAVVVERYQGFAAAAALAADQSQGVVDCLVSACVAVTWNASKSCADHTAACRRFLGANFRSVVHLGAASGAVLSGSIAAGRRSFAAVVGGCVDLAAALAEEAERCGDTALVTGAVADDCVAAGIAHRAQLWQAPGSPALEVMAVLPTEDEDMWLFYRGSSDSEAQERSGMVDSIAGLFGRACTGEPGSEVQQAAREELLRMRIAGDSCAEAADAAAVLAERIAKGGVRTRLMPPLWDADGDRPSPAHSAGRDTDALLMA